MITPPSALTGMPFSSETSVASAPVSEWVLRIIW
jgi:hypothetical protein